MTWRRNSAIYIIAQMVAKDPELMEDRVFNIAFVIDPKGEVIHKHYKTAFYQREPNVAPSDIWNIYLKKYGDDPRESCSRRCFRWRRPRSATSAR